MVRIPRSPGLALVTALLVVLAQPAASRADESLPSATIVKTRWGTTPRGATRVVFELDHPAEYRTTDAAPGGLEVRLLGVRTEGLPSPMPVGSGGVRDVTFRPDPSGVVARISGTGGRLTARTFRLDGPPRIVVDLTLQEDAADAKAPDVDPTPPGSAPATELRAAREPVAAPEPAPVTEPVAAPEPAPVTEPAAPEPPAVTGSEPATEEDLLAWIADLQRDANALKLAGTDEERRRHRRSLASLLSERGLAPEALTLMTPALESGSGDRSARFADSLRIAELRVETGDLEGAGRLARALAAGEPAPEPLLRLAWILARCDLAELAMERVQRVLPQLTGPSLMEARLLLATASWERKDVQEARRYVSQVTDSEQLPAGLRGRALLLEADCAWAQERIEESADLYRRALRENLNDEEASWATLQLGNAARRNGHLDDALGHYRDARDRWPDTFYGAQAGWFLRVAERTEPTANAGTVRDRG